ncbi:MAG: bifunctional [glutamate--ammonia ligase]-adenylyl-L-tyrosine phosphorylase/[glutamate--ammonia-ligase] adenylyltransferase [Alcaligenaceae bacterium]|nr:bifunctional [glutamate--ammonia ligase]-adenylyl-L-tyrosine phosphorylase/[glutamate--ammonia-ligase] adenylyltransferase [Alcaligenaceae bacterium]
MAVEQINPIDNPHLLIKKAAQWSQYLSSRLVAERGFEERLAKDIQSPLSPTIIDEWLDEVLIEALGASAEDLELLKQGDLRELRDHAAIAQTLAIDSCKAILRNTRKRVFCTLAVRDICSLAELEEVLTAISYFADLSVRTAYRSAMLQLITRHGEPFDPKNSLPLEMLILGMGKLGGKELNVSSDIDLIMLYPLEGQTRGDKNGNRSISHHEFYNKVTQRIANILSDQTADGFVFRTDLRLRPDGGGSALAWSLEALSDYLLKQGREWERYAWLKARAIPLKAFSDSQDQYFIHQFLSIQSPFVFRKYFDFDTLAALRTLREQIREDWNHRAQSRASIDSQGNIKLGEGGIREIEFIVQLAQLVRGGQMPSLRHANFFKALEAELQAGIIDEVDKQRLEDAYRFLRRIEHLLQYKADQQNHLLPDKTDDLIHLAKLFNLSLNEFNQKLNYHRAAVSQSFKEAFRLVGVDNAETPADEGISSDILIAEHGIVPTELMSDSDTALTLVHEQSNEAEQSGVSLAVADEALINALEPMLQSLQESYRIKGLNQQAKHRLNSLIPKMMKAVAQVKQPLSTFSRLMDLIDNVVQRSSYMALLNEYPNVLSRIVRMLDSSPWVADYITRNPIVLDKLIDWQELLEPIDIDDIMKQLQLDLDASVLEDGSPDMELQMNLMRDLKKQITFQLLAQDIEGAITVEHLADVLSLLADRLLEESMRRVWPLVCQRYDHACTPSLPKFAIISYGRLGGKELGYISDLDLVFLFDDASVEGTEIYTRFARRLTNWLSTMTSSGRLYDIDTRLRPDGNAGLLAVSIDGFENYQLNSAWLWEHQALTRARFSAGDADIGQRFEDLRQSILIRERDLATLKQGIVAMRQRMHDGHPNHSALFDLKHDIGGMVDIEFMTQYIVLAYSHQYPELIKNLGNIALLKMAGDYGLLPTPLAHQVADSYRSFRAKQHSLRLQGDDRARTEAQFMIQERQAVIELWNTVFPDAKKFFTGVKFS